MPSMTTAPDDFADILRDLGRGLDLIDLRREGYEIAKSFYDGDREEVSANKVIEKVIEKSAAAHPISLAHIPVDALCDKIELTAISAEETAAKVALAAWYDDNDIEDESDDWLRLAAAYGDYYVINDPLEEDAQGRATRVRSTGSSPLTTVVVYSSEDSRTPLFGVKMWKANRRFLAVVYYDDCSVLLETDVRSNDTTPKPADFRPRLDDDGDPDSYIEKHLGGRMLVEHIAIDGKPYGTPVHRKAFGPQDAITKISATNLAAVDGLGFPVRYALMDPMAQIDDDIDDDFGTAGPGSTDGQTTVTAPQSLKDTPGSMRILHGIRDIKQLDSAKSDDFLKNLDWYIRVMAVACGVPLFEFDLNGEQPSGEARRRAEGRINKHARSVARTLGRAYTGVGDVVLGLMGLEGTVAVSFRPTETETDKDGLELVGIKISNGVPVRQALLEAGYTAEQVDNWYPENAPHITPALLVLLSGAMQSLGQAKTLGVITDEELADLLPDILTGARNEQVAADPIDGVEPAAIEADPDLVGDLKAQADALGILVRAGADPEQAAAKVGLEGLEFPNVPTTVRIPETEAAGLEGDAPPPPAAP
jgi:hypothetical protein